MMKASMESNGNGKVYTSKSAPLVEKIRKRFFDEEWSKNSELYCPQDIERIRQSEWFVKRFLLSANRNVDEAFKKLCTTLQWRKKYDLPNVRPEFFPREFYEIGGLFSYEPDLEGNPVIYLRISMHKKIEKIHEPLQQFLFYTIDRVDQESGSKGCVIVFDCNGAGYSNMDMKLLKSLVDVAFTYFPFCIRYVIVYELSWMLNTFRKIAMNFIPSSLASIVRFANRSDIHQFIPKENLPDFMGGLCQKNYRAIPIGCRTVLELANEHGFTKEDALDILKQFEPILKEARNENKKKLIECSIEQQEYEEGSTIRNKDNYNGYDPETNNNNNLVKSFEIEEEEKDGEIKNMVATSLSPSKPSLNNKKQKEESIALVHSPASKKSFSHIASIFPQNVLHFVKLQVYPKRQMEAAAATTTASSSKAITMMTLGNDSDPEKENFQMSATIMIRNNHPSRSLAFKIQSNYPDRYSVTPNQGVLLPSAFISIRVVAVHSRVGMKVGEDDDYGRKTATTKNTANAAGKYPDLINQNGNQDKFLVLMSSIVIDPQVHLKNQSEFQKLFVKDINQVYVHKLIVAGKPYKVLHSLSSTTNEMVKKRTNRKQSNGMEMLINQQMDQIKHKYQRNLDNYGPLSSSSSFLSRFQMIFLMILISFGSFLIGFLFKFTNTQC